MVDCLLSRFDFSANYGIIERPIIKRFLPVLGLFAAGSWMCVSEKEEDNAAALINVEFLVGKVEVGCFTRGSNR
ncbi:MAG: hypothetical protein ACYSWR_02265 [Planctomycetota bacterium]|jgi:hypothetical protein